MKRALIFSPYIDSLGGGEVYTFNFAKCLHQQGFHLDIAWKNDPKIKKELKNILDISTNTFTFNKKAYQLLAQPSSLLDKFLLTRKYDLVFFLSDGSLPFLFSKNNIIHFQVPFTHLKTSPITKLKLATIHHLICNSTFTKKVIDTQLSIKSSVLYPPVSLKTSTQSKQNIILSVGRFTNALHNKRQDILIQAFKKMVDQGLKGWQLVLVGSDKEGKKFVTKLKTQATGYPINLKPNLPIKALDELYTKSKIFWLATGYDIDPTTNPELVEHFGIVTVEAISAGCVPVVINKGGQKEIISHQTNGFLFENSQELINYSQKLISQPQLLKQLSFNAQSHAKKFDTQYFCKQVVTYL